MLAQLLAALTPAGIEPAAAVDVAALVYATAQACRGIARVIEAAASLAGLLARHARRRLQ